MLRYIGFLLLVTIIFLLIAAVVGRQPCQVSFTGTYENISQTCECLGKEVPVEITAKNKLLGGKILGGELDEMPVETKELTMCYGFVSEKRLKY